MPKRSIAAQQGLLGNDVILEIDGVATNQLADLQPAYRRAAGPRVSVLLFRDQIEQTLEIDAGLVVRLAAGEAEFGGEGRRPRYDRVKNFLGGWVNPKAHLTWTFEHAAAEAEYDVFVELAAGSSLAGSTWTLSVGAESLEGQTPNTGGNGSFQRVRVGTLRLSPGQAVTAKLAPKTKSKTAVMNFRAVELVRQ